MKIIDIAVNLTDSMFKGIYHNKIYHTPDIHRILKRSLEVGIKSIFITGTSIEDSKEALHLCQELQSSTPIKLYCTAGIHPTNSSQFSETSVEELKIFIENDSLGRIVAIGEIGLDYERIQFASIEQQQICFRKQLALTKVFPNIPIFLHNRNSTNDLLAIIKEECEPSIKGVVHSFEGGMDEMESIIKAGFFISLNGCSLRSESNLKVAGKIPLSRLLVETDAPWCQIRKSHSSYPLIKPSQFATTKYSKYKEEALVDGRNEPCNVV